MDITDRIKVIPIGKKAIVPNGRIVNTIPSTAKNTDVIIKTFLIII